MKVAGRELFNVSEVTEGADIYLQKLEESEAKISKYQYQLKEIDEQLSYAIEQDILSDGGNEKQVQTIQSRKQNINLALDTEKLKRQTIIDLNSKALKTAIPELQKQFREDIQYFQSHAEEEIFRRLFEVRQEQEQLLLLLEGVRTQAGREVRQYEVLKNSAGYSEHEYVLPEVASSYNNPAVAYTRNPAYGAPIIYGLTDIRAIQTRINYNYNEWNYGVPQDRKAQKPFVTPEETQAFLDSLAE